jgi:hypothetical protein
MTASQAFLTLATAFGLASAAGLNAYIPLLIVAILSRLTSLITLNPPYDALSSWWVIGALTVLLVIEILVDKMPAIDTVNDMVHTFIRPSAGALLFAASTNVMGMHPVLAAVCGVIVAGGVHAAKAAGRPVITATTAGIGNAVASTAEDVVSFVMSLSAVIAPGVVLALILSALSLIVWRNKRRQRWR